MMKARVTTKFEEYTYEIDHIINITYANNGIVLTYFDKGNVVTSTYDSDEIIVNISL